MWRTLRICSEIIIWGVWSCGTPAGRIVKPTNSLGSTSTRSNKAEPNSSWVNPSCNCKFNAAVALAFLRSASTRQVFPCCASATARLIAIVDFPSRGIGETITITWGTLCRDSIIEVDKLLMDSASAEWGLFKRNHSGACDLSAADLIRGTIEMPETPVQVITSSGVWIVMSSCSLKNATMTPPRRAAKRPTSRFNSNRGRVGVSRTIASSTTRMLPDLDAAAIPASFTRATRLL